MRLGPGKLWSHLAAVLCGGLAVLAVEVAAWRVDLPEGSLAARARSWQTASAAECEMLSQSFGELDSHIPPSPVPLIGLRVDKGACAHTVGFDTRPVVTWTQVETSKRSVEYIGINRPSYSLLHLRAAVTLGYRFGPEVGHGYTCWLHRSGGRWEMEGCQGTWIS